MADSTTPQQDAALIFQANQTPDGYDDSPDELSTDDPAGGAHPAIAGHEHGRRKFDSPRNTERPCAPLASHPALPDPDVCVPPIEARRLTPPTRQRDHALVAPPGRARRR